VIRREKSYLRRRRTELTIRERIRGPQ
jgi:hypothetical protein